MSEPVEFPTSGHKASFRRELPPHLALALNEGKLYASWSRVAKLSGLSTSYVSKLGQGTRIPSHRTLDIFERIGFKLSDGDWAELRALADGQDAATEGA